MHFRARHCVLGHAVLCLRIPGDLSACTCTAFMLPSQTCALCDLTAAMAVHKSLGLSRLLTRRPWGVSPGTPGTARPASCPRRLPRRLRRLSACSPRARPTRWCRPPARTPRRPSSGRCAHALIQTLTLKIPARWCRPPARTPRRPSSGRCAHALIQTLTLKIPTRWCRPPARTPRRPSSGRCAHALIQTLTLRSQSGGAGRQRGRHGGVVWEVRPCADLDPNP